MILNGKVAIIAGANSGVGNATVRRFMDAGVKVVLVERNMSRLEETAKEAGLIEAPVPHPPLRLTLRHCFTSHRYRGEM